MEREEDYIDFDDSDPCEALSSSDDDMNIVLHGTANAKQKVHLRYKQRRGSTQSSQSDKNNDSSSEDDFEKEMNSELDAKVASIEADRKASFSEDQASGSSSCSVLPVPRSCYGDDDVYIDSDEEEMVSEGDQKSKRKLPKPSNDDLFYDPDMDDEDQKWIDSHRRKYQVKKSKKSDKSKALPTSDAVLDCPACMTTLCLDCQRHDVYDNQYRAMFVMNCAVDKSEKLSYPVKERKLSKKKKKKLKHSQALNKCADSTAMDLEESEEQLYNPVRCTECNTVVAVYDEEEVYHFFNVLASY